MVHHQTTTHSPTRLRLLRNLAFTQPRFRHEQAGYNFRMTGYQAAMGRVQLAKIDLILGREAAGRRDVLRGRSRTCPGITTPVEQPWARNVYWMYVDPGRGRVRAHARRADGDAP